MQAFAHAVHDPSDANRAGHFHGSPADLPKLRMRMDRLALAYRKEYPRGSQTPDEALAGLIEELESEGKDPEELIYSSAGNRYQEAFDHEERLLRAYAIAKRRYERTEHRVRQGALFEPAALAQAPRPDWYDAEIARIDALGKKMEADKKERTRLFELQQREDFLTRQRERTHKRPVGARPTVAAIPEEKLALRTSELRPGLRAWTMVGEALVEVEIMHLIDHGKGKQKTAMVKRVDTGKVLPKSRTAAALRRREAKFGYDPGPATAPMPRPSEVEVKLRPGAVPAPSYDLYEHAPTNITIHNPQGSSWTAYLAGEGPGRGRSIASATTAKQVEQLLSAMGPVGAIGYYGLKAQVHAAATAAETCDLPSDGMAKWAVEKYVQHFEHARGKVPHLVVGTQGVDGKWAVQNADDGKSVASFHSLECAEAAVRPTRGRADTPPTRLAVETAPSDETGVYRSEVLKFPKWWGEGAKVRVKETPWLRKHGLRVSGGARGDDRAWQDDIGTVVKIQGKAGWDWKVEFVRGRVAEVTNDSLSAFAPIDEKTAARDATHTPEAKASTLPVSTGIAQIGPNVYSHSPQPSARWLQKLYDTGFAHGEDLRNLIQDDAHGKRFADSSNSDRELRWILDKGWAVSGGSRPSAEVRHMGMGGTGAGMGPKAYAEALAAYPTTHGYGPNRTHEKAVRAFALQQLGAGATVQTASGEIESTPRAPTDYTIREESEPTYSKTGTVWRAYYSKDNGNAHATEETREAIERRLREDGPVATLTWVPMAKPTVAQKPSAVPHADLNAKEQALYVEFQRTGEASLAQLAAVFVHEAKDIDQANSWVRNSLRKLVALGLIANVARGVYRRA